MRVITGWYRASLEEVLSSALPTDAAMEADFARVLQGIYERHSDTMVVMARALFELRKQPAVAQALDSMRRERDAAGQQGKGGGGGAKRLVGRNIDTLFADMDSVHHRLR